MTFRFRPRESFKERLDPLAIKQKGMRILDFILAFW